MIKNIGWEVAGALMTNFFGDFAIADSTFRDGDSLANDLQWIIPSYLVFTNLSLAAPNFMYLLHGKNIRSSYHAPPKQHDEDTLLHYLCPAESPHPLMLAPEDSPIVPAIQPKGLSSMLFYLLHTLNKARNNVSR